MRVADFQARHLLLSLRTGEPTRLVRALTYEALCTSALGVRHEAVAWRHLRPAFVLAERLGDPNSMSQVLISAGITFTAMGKWRKGAEVLDRAETLFQDTPTGLAYELRNARIYSLMNHYVLGDLRVLAERLPALVREAEETGDLLFLANLRAGPAFMHHLACDDPEGARRGLCQIMDRLPPEGFLYQRHLELAARSNIDLYLGKVVEAWKWLNAQWQPLERSRMRLVQAIRITDLELRARIALAMAAKTPDAAERCRLLLLASKDTRKLSKEGVEYSMALVYRLNTVVAWLHGEREAAVGSALLSETAFASSDMALHANVMRRCRGLLKGGPGHDLVRESEAWMRRQGIVNPARMMQMFLPGMNPGKEPLAGLDGGGGGS